jgi:hypothetical protein
MSDLLTRTAGISTGPIGLSCDSKTAATGILKASATLDANTQMMLSPGLVSGVIRAEAKRIGRVEKGLEGVLPIDIPFVRGRVGGVGPGQLYPAAYSEVESKLKTEWNQFLAHMGINCGAGLRRGCGPGVAPLVRQGYPRDVIDPVTADFFIAGYLALRVKQAQKPGRAAPDQLQFGIGLYFGAFGSISRAQKAISPQDDGKSVITYPPVKAWLQHSSDEKERDVAAYIDEVFTAR